MCAVTTHQCTDIRSTSQLSEGSVRSVTGRITLVASAAGAEEQPAAFDVIPEPAAVDVCAGARTDVAVVAALEELGAQEDADVARAVRQITSIMCVMGWSKLRDKRTNDSVAGLCSTRLAPVSSRPKRRHTTLQQNTSGTTLDCSLAERMSPMRPCIGQGKRA